jgi:hypothetical protein
LTRASIIKAGRACVNLLARFVATVSLIATIAAHLGAIRRARAILFVPDGGFGYTILSPDWLRRLHPGGGNLTFFGTSYDRHRHNRRIQDLWGANSFIWIRQGFMLPHLGAAYDSPFSFRLFHAAHRVLVRYMPDTPCYFAMEGLIAATPAPAWLDAEDAFNGRLESRYYPLIYSQPAPALHVGESIRSRVSQTLRNRCGTDFPRRCAFYLRYRGGGAGDDTSSLNRMSSSLDSYLPAIRVLNRAGYQVLLTGDALAPAKMIAERAGGLVDWRAAGADRDEFMLFAGTEVDIHIGSLSGGSAYLYVTDIPALMLNAFAPGDALPRTTVCYKWLYDSADSLVGLEPLLGGMFYDHQLHGCRLVDNTPDEMAESVEDFIARGGARPYGVDPAELGFAAPWIRAAEGRLSPAWLRQYERRARIRPEQRFAAR